MRIAKLSWILAVLYGLPIISMYVFHFILSRKIVRKEHRKQRLTVTQEMWWIKVSQLLWWGRGGEEVSVIPPLKSTSVHKDAGALKQHSKQASEVEDLASNSVWLQGLPVNKVLREGHSQSHKSYTKDKKKKFPGRTFKVCVSARSHKWTTVKVRYQKFLK